MSSSSQLESLSVSERLQMMEDLWDTLQRQPEDIASPDWHEDVLRGRKAKAERGKASFLTLKELRARMG